MKKIQKRARKQKIRRRPEACAHVPARNVVAVSTSLARARARRRRRAATDAVEVWDECAWAGPSPARHVLDLVVLAEEQTTCHLWTLFVRFRWPKFQANSKNSKRGTNGDAVHLNILRRSSYNRVCCAGMYMYLFKEMNACMHSKR